MPSLTRLYDDILKTGEPVQFFFTETNGITAPAFEIDCCLTESFSASTTVTDFPVENGVNFSDHAINESITLKINFIVTNYPMSYSEVAASIGAGVIGSLSDSIVSKIAVSETLIKLRETLSPDGYLRSKQAFEKIESIRINKVPLQIYTNMREYQNMVITNFSVENNKDTQESLVGTLTFKEVRVVDIAEVTITPPNSIDDSVKKSAMNTKNAGNKPPKTLNDAQTKKAEKNKSWLLGLFEG